MRLNIAKPNPTVPKLAPKKLDKFPPVASIGQIIAKATKAAKAVKSSRKNK